MKSSSESSEIMGTAAADGKWISRVPVGAGWTGDFPVQGPQRFDNAPLIGAAFASRFSLLGTASAFDLDPAWSSSDDIPTDYPRLYVTFVEKDGEEHKFAVSEGDNLLDIAQANDLEMEGACGGSCACSTCHVIVTNEEFFDKMPEPEDDENDMLDLAFGLTETSRLGCQVKMTKELDGLVVKLPSMTRNLQASDFQ
ncbi:hypothetical protein H633G_08588 [Metarhizium anisopliae BRIP 53284]|nr:hypothetical protein H633G_08588 [Metarhizium anisopliae BRIP 53284]